MEQRRWDALFADLEAELEGEEARELDGEVRDRTRREHARLTLADRLVAHEGVTVTVTTTAGPVRGVVTDAAKDWVLVDQTLIPRTAIVSVRGLGAAARDPEQRPVAELPVGYALRRLAAEHDEVTCTFADGRTTRGAITRVGRDHVDIGGEAIPFRAIATVRP